MLPNMNLSEAKRESIEPNGYVVRVLRTNVDTKYNRLQLEVDIIEGDQEGYFGRLRDRAGFWGLTANLSLNKEDAWKFANAIEAFRDSNADFIWNDDDENDENELIGKVVGAITQRRHYIGNDGLKKSKMLVNRLVPVDTIRSGDFEVPADKYADDYPQPVKTGNVVDTTNDIPEEFKQSADDTPF